MQALPGADHGFLNRVLRIEGRAEHAIAVTGQRGAMQFQVGDIDD